VSWSTSFSLSGVSASDITADEEDAILEGIAACSDDIESDNLEITSITDGSSRRRSLLDDTSSASIEYSTTIVLETSSFSSADDLFSSVSDTVTSAVTSGNMTGNIVAAAVASGSSSLESATVDTSSYAAPDSFEATVTRTPVPSTDPTNQPTVDDHVWSDDDGDDDSSGVNEATIGVGVGMGIMVIGLLVGGSYYLSKKNKQKTKGASYQPQGMAVKGVRGRLHVTAAQECVLVGAHLVQDKSCCGN